MEKSSSLSRRSFLAKSALATAALTFGTGIPDLLASKKVSKSSKGLNKKDKNTFPADFWWGGATAAYQVEGAANIDGRGMSIWDTLSHTPGATINGDTGDVACDQYHRYEEDIKMMAAVGVKHYRFSISWPRVMPNGTGKVNEKGVDYYNRLVDTLLKNGIMPHPTLYHWDLPQALQDKYLGWQSREIVGDFGDYATMIVKRLGDRVQHWMTLNEISSMTYNAYGINKKNKMAPSVALGSKKEFNNVVHNALLAHGIACQAIRAASPQKCFVAAAENFNSYVPVIETPENIEAARLAFIRDERNGGIIMPILTGSYPEKWLEDMGGSAPDIQTGDMKLIGQPLDELGFNCYSGMYVQAAENKAGYKVLNFSKNYPKGNMHWLNIVPESIYWGIRMVSDAAGQKKLPIFISENGYADGVEANAEGYVEDVDRIFYYRGYLAQLLRAVNDGYPVTGYFPWSLMDNFEWNEGYSKRFGMVHVNYETQKRTPKLSYYWYQQVIKNLRIM
jgi:beta-glucosidase